MTLCKGIACSNLPKRKKALYNYKEGMVALFCKMCIPDGDVMINTVHKICEEPGCFTLAAFGFEERRARFCSKHKLITMVDVRSKKCKKPKCSTRASFGYIGENAIFCMKHKEDDMIDINSRICLGYNNTECPVRTRIEHDRQYCLSCDPDDSRRKRFKKYEDDFFEYVKNTLDIYQRNFTVKYDQKETAKKYALLDGIVFGDGIVVCLEIDEYGHRYYECDEHRMHLATAELLKKYPDNMVSWVRVNPIVPEDDQWSASAIKIRNERFDEVVEKVNEILMTKNTEIVYIGFT